ncbi:MULTISPECIES: hypothetical protein [Rhodococcus]|uniref:hypothetical protein n=1 Tax=Rhodococcus TaxID=1827 RepID=UPI001CF8C698|nr:MULTISPECIES: hypothetical protein [Rhodococcus]
MLEWDQPTLRDQYFAAAVMAGLSIALISVQAGFEWIHWWWYWTIVVTFSWIIFRACGNSWSAAGATWVQWRSSWVDTYHLTRIQFSADGYARVLRLKDVHGNTIHSFKIHDLQANPDLWDLVYNGILHSVASGNCDIDAKTRRVLKIPHRTEPRATRFTPKKNGTTPDPLARTTGRPRNYVPRKGRHRPYRGA